MKRASRTPRFEDIEGEGGIEPSVQGATEEGRRRFLAGVSLAAGGTVAAAALVPFAAAILTPVGARAPRRWEAVGQVHAFPLGETVMVRYPVPSGFPWAGYIAEGAAWVRRDAESRFRAFSAYCTHTGCPIRWHAGSEMFFCPCHGGAFHRDGTVAAGPPPRPLPLLPIRVVDTRVELLPSPMMTPEPVDADPTESNSSKPGTGK